VSPVHDAERRKAVRRTTVEEHGIVQARVRPGHDVALVNVSAAGALLESANQLRPGSIVEVHLSTSARRVSVQGRVLRCSVIRLSAERLWYRGAIGFEHLLPWFVDVCERGYSVPAADGRAMARGRGEASRAPL
jgi:hypothetical protein